MDSKYKINNYKTKNVIITGSSNGFGLKAAKDFHDKVFGKIFADRGYIGKDLFEELFVDGIHLITKIKKNMKNALMHIYDNTN